MLRTILSRPRLDREGLAGLQARWRAFAASAGASFFQDWTWVGCLAAERFRDPVLLEILDDDQVVALALFNRRLGTVGGDALYLHESDDPVLNSIFIEHNGPLLRPGSGQARQQVLARFIEDAMQSPIAGEHGRPRRLVLSGVGADCAEAATVARDCVAQSLPRPAPYVDFAALPPDEPFIARLSRNTRHQLRRSNRTYEGFGPLTVHRAESVETALEYLSKLIMLHDLTWKARGKPGAFATQAVRRFHGALVASGVPRGEVDLLRITAGPLVVGYLMNFSHKGEISAYQSGFNYFSAAGQHHKPGLTCHYLAIEAYRKAGAGTYDFLAGADRYKLSLANAQRHLYWLNLAPKWHPQGVAARVRALLRA